MLLKLDLRIVQLQLQGFMHLLRLVIKHAGNAQNQEQRSGNGQNHRKPVEQQTALHTDALLFDLGGQP